MIQRTTRPRGIICPLCGKSKWGRKRGKPIVGSYCRWRYCLTPGCPQKIRTHEKIEFYYPVDSGDDGTTGSP